ncbi:hypothetical protein PS016_23785, partial [Shigella sonnei]|nr:hypothetical protein [Shigella sonnei]
TFDERLHRTFFPVQEQLFTVDTFIFFADSKEDKRIYREELFPYWEKRSMKDFIERFSQYGNNSSR